MNFAALLSLPPIWRRFFLGLSIKKLIPILPFRATLAAKK